MSQSEVETYFEWIITAIIIEINLAELVSLLLITKKLTEEL